MTGQTNAPGSDAPDTAGSPDRPLPVEAEVRTHDLGTPGPAEESEGETDTEARPGEGENAPGFLKPGRPAERRG